MEEIEINVNCFNLKYTLESGQCFRWKKIEDNYYVGVIKDRVIKIRQDGNKIYVKSNDMNNLEKVIIDYFDLGTDYKKIEEKIRKIDGYVDKALNNTTGMRHLRQDFFETLISYIISANNNIPRISKSVEEISRRWGKEILFEGKKYYLFPTPSELKDVSISDYKECGVGFRDKYIYDTVKKINDKKVDFSDRANMPTEELRKKLIFLKGVGPKVADCILLFSCDRRNIFPIDVWVERVMSKLYFNGEKVSKKEIANYAKDNFGEYAGIVQQHLFYNIREGLI